MSDWRWFRFYSEFRCDPKLSLMSPHHQWAFVILLCLANENNPRGFISKLSDEEISYQLRMALEEWQVLKERFRAKGMIEIIGLGHIKITKWDSRQFASDNSTERVRKHRQKKAAASSPPTPPSKTETDYIYRYRDETFQITFHETLENVQVEMEREYGIPIAAPIANTPTSGNVPSSHSVQSNYAKDDRYSAPANCDRKFMQTLADWRTDPTANGIKPLFLQYLKLYHLPRTQAYRNNPPDMANARQWVTIRERDGRENEIEIHWQNALEWEERRKASDALPAGSVPIEIAADATSIAEPIDVAIARLRAKVKLPQYRNQALAEAENLGIEFTTILEGQF